MVKKERAGKRGRGQVKKANSTKPGKGQAATTPETHYEECSERLTAFGGLLARVKFLDVIRFKTAFEGHYVAPRCKTQLGDYRMVLAC